MLKRLALASAALVPAAAGVLFFAPGAVAAPAHGGSGVPSAHGTGRAVTGSDVPAATQGPLATYNGACGAGYGRIDYMNVVGGTVFLTYNSSNGYNCVVTVRTTSGAAVYMDAGIKLTGTTTWIYDHGNYTTYAGPEYVHAASQCIDWYGTIGDSRAIDYDSHCG